MKEQSHGYSVCSTGTESIDTVTTVEGTVSRLLSVVREQNQ